MDLDFLEQNLCYCRNTGKVFLCNLGNRIRELIPNEDRMLITTINSVKIKVKMNKLVMCLIHGLSELPSGFVVLHKDLDEDNYRANNLQLVSKAEKKAIDEALYNLQGGLTIKPHKTDMFSYVINYKLNGRKRQEVISDQIVARRKFLRIQLKFAKMLDKFVVSS